MTLLTRTVNILPPRSLVIAVVNQTLQLSWLAPLEASGTVTYTVYVDGAAVASQTGLSYTTIALVPGSHGVAVYATDSRGYTSVAVTGTASVTSSLNTIKFNPGMGAHLDPSGYSENPTRRALDMATIDELGALPFASRLQIQIKRRWSSWEGATRGDYTAGKEMVQAYADRCALYGMHFQIALVERSFVTSNFASYYPAYVLSNGSTTQPSYLGGGPWSGGLTSSARVDQAATMDALIELFQSYGSTFNSHPAIECIGMEAETANGNPTIGANTAGQNTQFKRFVTAVRAAWPNTGMRLYVNFHWPYVLDLYEHCVAQKCGIGGPDPELRINADGSIDYQRAIDGNEWFRGLGRNNDDPWHAPMVDTLGYPTRDYRDVIPWFGEQQGLGTGGIDGFNESATEIDLFQRNTMKSRYILFPRANEGGQYAPNQSWSGAGGYLERITAAQGRVAFETKPTSYP